MKNGAPKFKKKSLYLALTAAIVALVNFIILSDSSLQILKNTNAELFG